MHDALNIITESECVRLTGSVLAKLVFEPSLNVVIDDVDILISVWPGVFVVEANGVTELVDHNTTVDTA